MGYSGGKKKNPSYYSLGDHTETIQIDFDPTKISYEKLLEIFWASHRPTDRPWSRQYMKAIFYQSEEQKRLAEASRDRLADRLKARVFTQILPAGEFYLAEDYHQKYLLRRTPDLLKEYSQLYSDNRELIASTAVARVNGYLGGYGTPANLKAELSNLGLSPAGSEKLLRLVQSRWGGGQEEKASLSGACPR